MELAQICKACSRLKFSNNKLNSALSVNILALTDADLNPRAVLNILTACNRIGLANAEVARCLVCTPLHVAVAAPVTYLEP